MAEDLLISQLMSETFQHSEERDETKPIATHAEQDFHIRRALSKFGVVSFEGEWLQTCVARFNVNGHVLDLPAGHQPFTAWFSDENEILPVARAGAFLRVLGELTHSSFDHILIAKSVSGHPWMVFWDSEEQSVDPSHLLELFSTELLKKVA